MHYIDTPAQILPNPTAASPAETWRTAITHSHYPAHSKSVLFSLVDLIEERSWSQSEVAKKIKHGSTQKDLSTTTLSQLLNGKYPGDHVAVCRSIERFTNQERARSLFAVSGFVETPLYQVLTDLADAAVITQRIACLHGGMLRGKTTNAHYLTSRYDRASVVFMTAPYADSYAGFVRRLARLRNIPLKGSLSDLREAILQSLDSSHLLLIDEFHQPAVTYSFSQARRVYEFIREINDLSRCGILLIGSTEGFAFLATEPEYERIAASMTSYDVSKKSIGEKELAAVLKSFTLEPHPDRIQVLRQVAEDQTLAKVFDLLRLASGRAARRKQPFGWQHFLETSGPALQLAS